MGFLYNKMNLVIIVFLLITITACITPSGKKTQEQKTTYPVSQYDLGRLSFSMPKEFKLTKNYQSINYVDLKEIVLEDIIEDHKMQSNGILTKRINEIKKEFIPPENYESVIVDSLIIDTLPYKGYVVYFNDEVDDEKVTIEMLNRYPKHLLWLCTEGYKEYLPELLEELNYVSRKYKDNKEKIDKDRTTFCLQKGSISLNNPDHEEMFLAFTCKDVVINVEVETSNYKESKDLFERFNSTYTLMTYLAFGVRAKKIRKQEKTVAGINGREMLTLMKEKNKDDVYYFIFQVQGDPDNAMKPNITIELTADKEGSKNREELIAIWDTLLSSMTTF